MTTTGETPAAPDDAPSAPDEPPVERPLSQLPEPVRSRIIEWAASALGAMPATDVPATLRRVARFAPGKRARVAAPTLADAMQTDMAFRAMVAERAANIAVDATSDVHSAAARAYLLRTADEAELLKAAAQANAQADAASRVVELERQVRSLASRLERTEKELSAARAAQPTAAASAQDSDRLRLRLREQGTRLRELQDRVDQLEAGTAGELVALTAERDRARTEAREWRQRADAANARADAATTSLQRLRESSGDRRATDDRRLELLLAALEGAASGLRREWNLIGGGQTPADVVAAGLPVPTSEQERTTDPARLVMWLGLPGAHLIVDGYNVTKTGFAELALADQRDRLVRSLAALAARTSAEVTVVFDGAAVATPRPLTRGVRVLFSPPGVLADDVIADLVCAEPRGRVVVVVTSDRQVADRAMADGARSAASSVLLSVLGG